MRTGLRTLRLVYTRENRPPNPTALLNRTGPARSNRHGGVSTRPVQKQRKRLTVKPRNVSNKPGYDNQPFFHPTRSLLYYTTMMPDGQTDIWSYGLRTSVTHTPDSEYLPTVLPSQTHLSCIVQRKATGDQDLISYLLTDPEKTEPMLESQKTGKIGYQAWLNADEALVFVLGTPQTMPYINRKTGQDTVIAGQIGRSLHRIPGQRAFSYVQQVGETWGIRSYDPARNQVRDITTSDSAFEHYNAWLNETTLLESRGTEL